MSILADPRRFSDNEEEYLQWKSDCDYEFRRQQYYDDHPYEHPWGDDYDDEDDYEEDE